MRMKKTIQSAALLCAAVLVAALSIWGPEALAQYRDNKVLGEIHTKAVEEAGEGYRYAMSSNEKLYLLSACLSSRTMSEGGQSGWTQAGNQEEDYQVPSGSYAFVVNHRGPTGQEITGEQIYESCNEGIKDLKVLGILPESLREVSEQDYEAVLYSAIDVPEPRNNVSVWKVSLSENRKNTDKANRLIDAYIDADSGKIYEFYVRTDQTWEETDPDQILKSWQNYLGLGAVEDYESDNPLLETTPWFKKYVFEGMDGGKTVVTIGFYEGINELFLKVSK